jgi:hypothetical protein
MEHSYHVGHVNQRPFDIQESYQSAQEEHYKLHQSDEEKHALH